MTHTIAEIDEKIGLLAASGDAELQNRPLRLEQLKVLLAELWDMPDSEARDRRRRVRALIDKAGPADRP